MSDYELCDECGSKTGRAGRGDDSLYIGDFGPYCEECFDTMPEVFAVEASNQKIIASRLCAHNAELVKALRNVLSIAEGHPTTSVQAECYMRHARVTLSRSKEQPHD